jgi:hypothetical protein
MQLEGAIKFQSVDAAGVPTGTATDYSAEIHSLVLTKSRAAVTIPPTFANADETTRAGAGSDRVTINFHHNELSATSFSELVRAAMDTDRSEIAFDATFKTGVVSVTNPRFTGIIILTELDLGGTPGQYKQQSKTYPIRNLARATT